MLKVTNLSDAVEFYTGTLGFSLVWQATDDGGAENAMLQAGGASLML